MIIGSRKCRHRPVFLISASSRILALIPLTVLTFASSLDADQGPASVERSVWAMGTRLSMVVEAGDRETAVRASEAGVRAVTEVEKRLSTWIGDSELSRLNGAEPGVLVPISPELEADLREATHWFEETHGAFDPGIASLMTVWDVRGGGREPSVAELMAARATTGLGHLHLDSGVARINTAGFGIEEGAFGKGIALREAADAALAAGADCVVLNFSGQVAIEGDCREFKVAVADPDQREDRIAFLGIESGSVATSGNSERGLVVNGVVRSHLLDPRTGFPAPDWGTVTVVARDPVMADCLSTALFIMGPKKGREWLREWPEIEVVFIERIGVENWITTTPGLKDRLEPIGGKLACLPQDPVRIEETQ